MTRREAELAQPGALDSASCKAVPLKKIIERYLEEHERIRPLGKTKRATLSAIRETWLGGVLDRELTSQKWSSTRSGAQARRAAACKLQTVGNDLTHLGAVMEVAGPAWGYEVDPVAMPARFCASWVWSAGAGSVIGGRARTNGISYFPASLRYKAAGLALSTCPR